MSGSMSGETLCASGTTEAKFVFALDGGAAVCQFEAFIDDKHIVGVVKEKSAAKKEYKEAIQRGDGAYLMEQNEEQPDLFTISIGNLPPGATVLIKFCYVQELAMDGDNIAFRLPNSVSDVGFSAASADVTQVGSLRCAHRSTHRRSS